MSKITLNINDIEKYKINNLIDELYKIKVIPLAKKQAKRIDDDIRECIKLEIKTFGSIIKRYGDWAKFVTKEIMMVDLPEPNKCCFHSKLYYRGKFIRDYKMEIRYGGY